MEAPRHFHFSATLARQTVGSTLEVADDVRIISNNKIKQMLNDNKT